MVIPTWENLSAHGPADLHKPRLKILMRNKYLQGKTLSADAREFVSIGSCTDSEPSSKKHSGNASQLNCVSSTSSSYVERHSAVDSRYAEASYK